MNAQLSPKRMSAGEYLAWDATQEMRHEFVAGELFPMPGGTVNHNIVNGNLVIALRQALCGRGCEAFCNGLRLRVEAADACFYPDVLVTCDPRDLRDGHAVFVQHAWLVAEVLSDSTAGYDRGAKFQRYRASPSLTHCLLVETDRARVDLFCKNDQGLWVLHPLGPGDRLRTGEPHVLDIPIDALYEGVSFEDAA